MGMLNITLNFEEGNVYMQNEKIKTVDLRN